MMDLLSESREEGLRKKYSDKFDDNVLDFILSAPELKKTNHKYSDFVLKNILPESDIDYMVDFASELIRDFDKYQSVLEKKDIKQYSNFEELYNALEESRKKQETKRLEKIVDKIYEDDKFLIIKPITIESSCKYGANTKWCVAAKKDNQFYNLSRGNQKLYYIINKLNSTEKTYSKIAVHYDEDGYRQIYDSKNKKISPENAAAFIYAFPKLIAAIENDYGSKTITKIDKFLYECFDIIGEYPMQISEFEDRNATLNITVQGFENDSNYNFGHAVGRTVIYFSNEKNDDIIVGDYDTYFIYTNYDNFRFRCEIGFVKKNIKTVLDFKVEDFSPILIMPYLNNKEETASNFRGYLAKQISDYVKTTKDFDLIDLNIQIIYP